jgi:hypothetical protein
MEPEAFRSVMNERQPAPGIVDRRIWLAVGLTGLLAAGCWNSVPPGRVTAHGVISVEGKPLPDGEISFEPVEDGIGGGVTRIESGGQFSLFLRPGTYRVGIVSVEGGVGPGGVSAADPAKLRVSASYAKPEASGLEYTIDASNRRLTIDLPK